MDASFDHGFVSKHNVWCKNIQWPWIKEHNQSCNLKHIVILISWFNFVVFESKSHTWFLSSGSQEPISYENEWKF